MDRTRISSLVATGLVAFLLCLGEVSAAPLQDRDVKRADGSAAPNSKVKNDPKPREASGTRKADKQDSAVPIEGSSQNSPAAEHVGQSKERLRLINPTRVDTQEAARSVARKRAAQASAPGGAKAEDRAADATVQNSSDSPVDEFKPASTTDGGGSLVLGDHKGKNSKDSALKRVHGSVYGEGGAGGHAEGGSVGATSKSGKGAIYVETGRTKTDVPAPR